MQMKNGDDRLYRNRLLLSGGFVAGLLLFLLAEWRRAPSVAAMFFLWLYLPTGLFLLLYRGPKYWVVLGGLLNGAALIGFHWLTSAGSPVWMLYLSTGALLAWRWTSSRPVAAVMVLLSASFLFLEGRPTPAGTWDAATLMPSFLWSLLLMLLLHDGWWQRRRLVELEGQCDGLRRRVEELREHTRRVIRKAEEWSTRDSLTGLYNFRGFQQKLRQAMRNRSPMLLLLLDVVSFSEFNAYMGREAGDELLCNIADVLKKEMPEYSILSRYAGDKFAVAFAYEGKTEAELEEQIRSVMERIVTVARPVRYPLRYCVGMAIYPRDGQTWQEMFNVAEQRLTQRQRALSYNLEAVRMRKERLSTIGQLAAALAHEIRNPLTSVRGFVQLAAEQTAVMDRWKDIILSEIDRIDALLSRLLEVADHQQQRPQLICLNEVIQKTMELMHSEAVMRGCQLKPVLPERPIYAWLEVRQFQQVLVQLIQYGMLAAENVEEGYVEVTLDEQADTAILTVRDNGTVDARCGDMSEWGSDGLHTEYFGPLKDDLYGFGLSLIQQIVTEHGGQLSIHLLPLGGKEVVLILPKGDGERELQLVASRGCEHVE